MIQIKCPKCRHLLMKVRRTKDVQIRSGGFIGCPRCSFKMKHISGSKYYGYV